jgi:hypothetical protein
MNRHRHCSALPSDDAREKAMQPGIFASGRSEVLASYRSYAEAQDTVDHLTELKTPDEHLAIVASDLRWGEQVPGQRGYGEAVLSGAAGGTLTGVMLGVLLALFNFYAPPLASSVAFAWGATLGGTLGLAIGWISRWVSDSQLGFSSAQTLHVGRYDVLVNRDVAERARASPELRSLREPGELPMHARCGTRAL